MKCIGVQMLDQRISSDWWKAVTALLVKENDKLQIRCWNEESDEIDRALKYGASHIEGNETCIDGIVCADFRDELLNSAEPEDKAIYNKMTKYFTIRTSDGKHAFESSHYGTELYIVTSPENTDWFNEIMKPYADSFSISITDI